MGVDFGGDQFYLQGCYNLYMHESSFRKLVLQEGRSSVRGYLHGHVYMKDTVLRKWSLLEGQPLIQGLFPWKCLYEGYCFRKVVFLRGIQPLIQGLFPWKCMSVCRVLFQTSGLH